MLEGHIAAQYLTTRSRPDVSTGSEMAHNEVLEDEDLADGYVLACQSVALTPAVSVTYD